LGENTIIEGHVYIGDGTQIGNNVLIQAGAVIGCTGQGFERNESGVFEKFPQIGTVHIEDDVEIGANSTIVRGALTQTRIGRGTKIGHLTDIGHNVQIGENVFVSAGVVVCGSVQIGDGAWLSPQSCVRNKVVIGERATVGLGAVVAKNVPQGITVIGKQAKPMKNV